MVLSDMSMEGDEEEVKSEPEKNCCWKIRIIFSKKKKVYKQSWMKTNY